MKLDQIKPLLEGEGKTTGEHDMSQWVSTEQAAKIIGVSTGRIRQFVQDGRLTSHQPTDSDHYFKRADVEALAKKPRERTGRPPEGEGKKED
jgi:excisionase family DNA binding protein